MLLETILLIIFLFFPVFVFKTFEEAGYKGWQAFLPLYNYYIWLQVVKKPLWWFIFLIIPFINYFMIFLLVVETAKCYNKFSLKDQALAVVLFFYYLPHFGVSDNETYTDPDDRPEIKKSATREWVDAIIFAVVAASIIRMFLVEAYTIPTSSMEKSLLVGDFLFVSKISYGPKAPNTPVSFPFVHHTLPLTKNVKSYVDWVQLPYHRFPGLTDIKHNDVVVFNFPVGDTVSEVYQSNRSYYSLIREYGRDRVNSNKRVFGDLVHRPVDKRENFIKRCIGLPGDTIKIIDQQVYVNGEKNNSPGKLQYKYIVKTDGSRLNTANLQKMGITEGVQQISNTEFLLTLTEEAKNKVQDFKIVKSVKPVNRPDGVREPYIFPHDTAYKWNVDNFGPLWIPKKGSTIKLNQQNIVLYKRAIEAYEGN
ncbi:MAG TPA: signal peptidase I, partial [Bacteroidales bacterium]|nr:signal peptidase I [Bacteroidales bacterium]